MLLTSSINTGKFILCVSEQELNLIGIAIRELRDNESEGPTSLDVLLQVDAATFAEALRHQEETLGINHGCNDCDNCSSCGDKEGDEPTPNWINDVDEENRNDV